MERDCSDLIMGYLKGSLSTEEKDLFFKWVNEREENKKLFFDLKVIYDASFGDTFSGKIEDSWQRLLDKKKNAGRPKHLLWRRIASYAAVILVTVGITSALFLSITDNERENLTAQYIGGDGLEADVVVMPDGTRISLGSKTNFHYENEYGKSTRTVYLEGEAYFEVKQQKNKPFIVKVNGQDIEVLGTKFNVMAYPNDSIFTTTLLEGSVSLDTEGQSRKTILQPDQQFIYNRNKGTTQVNDVDARQYIAWTSGYYYFPDQRLQAILHRLSHIYGVTFSVSSEKLNNTMFTGTFYRGQSIKDILEIIKLSIPIKYTIEDHQVTIFN